MIQCKKRCGSTTAATPRPRQHRGRSSTTATTAAAAPPPPPRQHHRHRDGNTAATATAAPPPARARQRHRHRDGSAAAAAALSQWERHGGNATAAAVLPPRQCHRDGSTQARRRAVTHANAQARAHKFAHLHSIKRTARMRPGTQRTQRVLAASSQHARQHTSNEQRTQNGVGIYIEHSALTTTR